MRKRKLPVLLLILIVCLYNTIVAKPFNPPTGSIIIILVSNFLDKILKGNMITEAGMQQITWLLNNTGMVLNSETNLMTQVSDTGRWNLLSFCAE